MTYTEELMLLSNPDRLDLPPELMAEVAQRVASAMEAAIRQKEWRSIELPLLIRNHRLHLSSDEPVVFVRQREDGDVAIGVDLPFSVSYAPNIGTAVVG